MHCYILVGQVVSVMLDILEDADLGSSQCSLKSETYPNLSSKLDFPLRHIAVKLDRGLSAKSQISDIPPYNVIVEERTR